MFSEKKVAEYLNKGQKRPESAIVPKIDRDFELVTMPSPELTREFLPPLGKLSEMSLFDRQALEYFDPSEIVPLSSTTVMGEILPSVDGASSILPTWDEIERLYNSSATTQSDSGITNNPLEHKKLERFEHQRVSIPPTGILDVFLALCAQSVGNLISTLTKKNANKTTPAMLQGKLLLNLNEAQILSGLSRTIVMNAIKNHELPFQLIGNDYRVKAKDLERFVDKL
jgi:hypothetical protein